MPLYEYQCESCEQTIERIQKFSDPPLETCPSCGGTLKKLLSSPAFQFKGTGWYITDYARKGGKSETPDKAEKTEKTDKTESSEKSGKSESSEKSESKTTEAKTTETKTT
jgi:putative FmdB family regulatory protein